jgi:hypothetical protein
MENILFEAQFNNNPKLICRVSAPTKEIAISKFKEVYPNDIVIKIYEP